MLIKTLADLKLTPAERALLDQHGFDFATFCELQKALANGQFGPERNITTHTLAPPPASDLIHLPEPESPEGNELEALGLEAIRKGQVAVAVLNGGMATRFGGRVKGVVEVADGKSFMELRLGDIRDAQGQVPVFLMNSFATEVETKRHLDEHHWFGLAPTHVHLLTQRIFVRLMPTGEVFRDRHGRIGFYAPGHGDVFEVLAASAGFKAFASQGGKLLAISNIDNLGATLCPRVLGAHLKAAKPVTVEVADREPGDKGGAPVLVDGRLAVLEGFRFPKSFDIGQVPVFNTNSMVVNVSAVKPNYSLTWFRADKDVEGQSVVQFERLMGEVTSFVDAAYLWVPRDGNAGRFMPVKTPQDLEIIKPLVRKRFHL